VLVVVDGLPQRQVTDYRDQLGPDGFNRFLQRGAWFADAHYGHAYTVTAIGHATLLTGAYPTAPASSATSGATRPRANGPTARAIRRTATSGTPRDGWPARARAT